MILAPPRKRRHLVLPRLAPLWTTPRNMFVIPVAHVSAAAGGGTVDPVLMQSIAAANNNTGATVAPTWPGATTAGNLLIACVSAGRANAAGSAPTFTPPDVGWLEAVTDVCNPTGTRIRTSIYYKANASSESGSKTWTSTVFSGACSLGVVMAEYSGITASSPLDQTASAADTNTASTTCGSGTTATTAQARELAIAALRGGSALGSAGNGFTIQSQTSQSGFTALLDKLLTSTGTPSTSATYSTGQNNVGCIATFKVAN